ncbi:MAG: M28 family peptidase, partial [Fuerstia sp.]|nr:M28 family peptidase [Fuerstiella sp.]
MAPVPLDSDQELSKTLPERLFRHVDMLAGVIGPRHPGKRGSMEATAAYIDAELKAIGLTVTRETYRVGGQPTDNVVVNIPGTTRPNEIVILGAHYDSTPATPGADDNGSAVAVMIETARLLHEIVPARSVRFVAFACEESPYFHTGEMGSMIHARGCTKRGENVVAMLCLEMVGYFVDHKNSQQVPPGIPKWLRWLFPSRGDFLAAVANPQSWKLCWQFRRGF